MNNFNNTERMNRLKKAMLWYGLSFAVVLIANNAVVATIWLIAVIIMTVAIIVYRFRKWRDG